MKIILKNKYNAIRKTFDSKEDLLMEIDNTRFYECSSSFDEYCKNKNIISDYYRWTVSNLVDFFYNDYEIEK